MSRNMGLKLTNYCGPQVLAKQTSTARRALDHNVTSWRSITGSPANQFDLDLRANELDVAYQVLMDAVYQVLKCDLPEPQRHQSWEKMIDDVLG